MKYIDLLIENDTIALDDDGLPIWIGDSDSIAQDIRHAIRESGYLELMIAERSKEIRQLYETRIIRLVEEDTRIKPGEVTMTQSGDETWNLLANTYEFGTIDIGALA